MKGLSINTKTMATVFLFVCLAANSQIFQSSLNDTKGSSTLASSINIETSSVLPSMAENCELKEGSEVKEAGSIANEADIVNSKLLQEKIIEEEEIDESNMSARERREAARKRRNNINKTSNRQIEFKFNFKTYVCKNEGKADSIKREYEVKDISTPEGSIKCTGNCKVGVSQTATIKEITNRLLNNGVKEEINLQYEISKLRLVYKQKEDNCEGEMETYSSGSIEFFEYEIGNEKDDKLHRECLVKRIKKLKRNKSKALDMFDILEGQLAELAQSTDKKDRKEALRLINKLHGRTGRGLNAEIKASVRNIRNYARGANAADTTVTERDKQIEYYKNQACSPTNQKLGCLAEYYVKAKIESLQMFKQRELEFGKYNYLNKGWSITKGEGGDESYNTWHTNLTNYFDQNMKKISGIYTGPADINKKLADSTPSNTDYNNRFDFLSDNNSFNDIRSTVSTLGKDVGPVPTIFTTQK